jgi:hypothetical protein
MVANAMKISHLEMIRTTVVKVCIYCSHKIKEIPTGTIVTLDSQLRHPVAYVAVINQVYFSRGYLGTEARRISWWPFCFFCACCK